MIYRRGNSSNFQRSLPVRINSNSPQAEGLIFAVPFAGTSRNAVDVVHGREGVFQNALPLIGDGYGVATTIPEFSDASPHWINFSGMHVTAGSTISCWISVDRVIGQSNCICGEWDNPSNVWLLYAWQFGVNTYRIAVNGGTNDRYFAYTPPDRWAHIVFDTAAGQGYLNGVAQSMTGTQDTWSSTASSFQIGKWAGNNFNGRLYDLRIYSRCPDPGVIWQMWDKATRWDLYSPLINRRAKPFAGLSITSVSPNSGVTTGGTSVTITGTGFQSTATVSFNGDLAADIIVVNSTTITCKTPAHAVGTVDVQISQFV